MRSAERLNVRAWVGVLTLSMVTAGVGCDEVTLTATLTGKGVRGAATATVPFACGE